MGKEAKEEAEVDKRDIGESGGLYTQSKAETPGSSFSQENGRAFVHPGSTIFDAQASREMVLMSHFTKMSTSKVLTHVLYICSSLSLAWD